MDKLKRAVVKEEIFAITQNQLEALILNQFLYWTERTSDFDLFIKEEIQISERLNDQENLKMQMQILKHGWIYKKVLDLKEELMLDESEVTIRRKIQSLVKKGYIQERHNPNVRYDRTLQYRVNLDAVVIDMYKAGYVLQGYRVDLSQLFNLKKAVEASNTNNLHSEGSNLQNEASKIQNEGCNLQFEGSNIQNEVSKIHSEGAIPEITTETTTEKNYNAIDNIKKGQSIWQEACKIIKTQLTEISYNSWISCISVADYYNNILVLQTPSEFNSEIIKQRFQLLINQTITAVDPSIVDIIIKP